MCHEWVEYACFVDWEKVNYFIEPFTEKKLGDLLKKTRLRPYDVLRRAEYGGERVVVERHGKPVAAIVSIDDLRRLEATDDKADVRDARVSLTQTADLVELTIVDRGRGFDPAARRGLGLLSMEERARLTGGAIAIASAPGTGTTIQLQVPVRAD